MIWKVLTVRVVLALVRLHISVLFTLNFTLNLNLKLLFALERPFWPPSEQRENGGKNTREKIPRFLLLILAIFVGTVLNTFDAFILELLLYFFEKDIFWKKKKKFSFFPHERVRPSRTEFR